MRARRPVSLVAACVVGWAVGGAAGCVATPVGAPALAPPVTVATTATRAEGSSPSPAPSASPAPPLTGAVFASLSDESGFVYEPSEFIVQELDLRPLRACYAEYAAKEAPPSSRRGLPGWARFRQRRTSPIAVETTALEDSGLPEGLRRCLLLALEKADLGSGASVKEVYLSLR